MADYSEDIAGALEMITEAGTTITWIEPSSAGDDATKPWLDDESAVPDTYENVPAVFIPPNRVDFETLRQIKGTEIPQSFEKILLPGAVDFSPSTKGVCVKPDGRRYTVLHMDTYQPDLTPILYEITLVNE